MEMSKLDSHGSCEKKRYTVNFEQFFYAGGPLISLLQEGWYEIPRLGLLPRHVQHRVSDLRTALMG